jgi:purine nucleoside phosphorylase
VTNLAAGLSSSHLSHEEVSETGRQVERRLAGLLERVAGKIADLVSAETEAKS